MASEQTNRLRVGEVELAHGADVVSLVIHGRHRGATVLTPDDADALADRLSWQAAAARETR